LATPPFKPKEERQHKKREGTTPPFKPKEERQHKKREATRVA
jgi:hypothetical protein